MRDFIKGLKSAGLIILISAGCNDAGKQKSFERKGVDYAMLDSLKKNSDSIYSKPYQSRDFAKADYYVDSKDSTVSQLMRDSNDSIRQIIITRNNKRTHFSQYFGNGQLIVAYSMDDYGQYQGDTKEYYENGAIKSSGNYHGGLRTGNWKMYEENGNYKETMVYNADGQQEKIIKENINN